MDSHNIPIAVPFTSKDAWSGGHYEVAIEFGETSDAHVAAALQRFWSYPGLDGPYLLKDQVTSPQHLINPEGHLDEKLYGVAEISNGAKVSCGSARWHSEGGTDWLNLFLPLGSLAKVYPIGAYPFAGTDDYPRWRQDVDSWMVGIARHIYQKVRFDLAIIGFEVDAANLSAMEIKAKGVPRERLDGLLWPTNRALDWYPPTGAARNQ